MPNIHVPSSDQLLGDADEQFELLISIAVRHILAHDQAGPMLEWIGEHGASISPSLAAQGDPRAGPAAHMFRALGVLLYNATPRPDTGWVPRPLAKPGRNDPCWCGSGTTFKHCCDRVRGHANPFANLNMLRFMLAQVGKGRYAELPGSRVDTEAVADAAFEWIVEGNWADAEKLLDPWFKTGGPLTARLEPLLRRVGGRSPATR